ncbi:putative cytochrome P450 hydroxylase [Cystobacter fuscus DSM 2262]|uniref:Cytochrome P450 hydroxylase n=1 Tax=Cystobacter fuscus (strain ATCC 25194 / DSM 2262 / NBRC 100088 / M29) TaxID=1242864 RepID=S9PM37_CYSF2|nr:cytochrome P450 [Cystobacter fuscus]EPX65330.1 putative cytochrome P450 hydroxylase [Cystobacter fuscus DSM 2262]
MQSTPDLMTLAHRLNPYPLYAELRRNHPVCRVEPGGLVAVSRYKDVEYVLKHPEFFSSHGFRIAWQPEWAGDNPLAQSLAASDGKEHARLRSLVSRAFTPVAINRLDEKVRANAARLAEGLHARGEVDFMEEFATPLPARTISDLLGIDPTLERHYKRWTEVLVSIAPVPENDEHVTRTRDTIAELKHYVQQIIDARRSQPSDDVMGLIVRGGPDGQRLSDQEIIGLAFTLLAAGLETTSFFFAHALPLLAERPDVFERLRADRELLPKFIEEMLRYDGPVRGLPRIVTADVELSGVRIERGACVLSLIASANRDEVRFPHADRFDLDREQTGISFGAGSHFCLGAFLARLEARAGLGALLDRFSGFSLLPEGVVWNRSLVTSGPLKMPVRFLPA